MATAMKFVWVLVYVVNGVTVKEPPTFAEACLQQAEKRRGSQCVHADTGLTLAQTLRNEKAFRSYHEPEH